MNSKGGGSHPGERWQWERAQREVEAWIAGDGEISVETFEFLDAMIDKVLCGQLLGFRPHHDELRAEAWLHLVRFSLPNWSRELQAQPNFVRWFFYSLRLAIGAAFSRCFGVNKTPRRRAMNGHLFESLNVEGEDGRRYRQIPYHDETAEQDAHAEDVALQYRRQLRKLTARERKFVRWRYVDETTLAEIGGLTGTTKENVRQTLARIIANLRRRAQGKRRRRRRAKAVPTVVRRAAVQ